MRDNKDTEEMSYITVYRKDDDGYYRSYKKIWPRGKLHEAITAGPICTYSSVPADYSTDKELIIVYDPDSGEPIRLCQIDDIEYVQKSLEVL